MVTISNSGSAVTVVVTVNMPAEFLEARNQILDSLSVDMVHRELFKKALTRAIVEIDVQVGNCCKTDAEIDADIDAVLRTVEARRAAMKSSRPEGTLTI